MNKEAQRIAIAKLCGFIEIHNWRGWNKEAQLQGKLAKGGYYQVLPDYLNDINAMHEAFNVIPEDKEEEFMTRLYFGDDWQKFSINHCDPLGCLKASASQLAEAFLKTLNKWEEGE
jgi:hypothetical protein